MLNTSRKDQRRKGARERRLECGTPYAMRRPKAWRGGSKAQQSCVSATALEQKIMRGLSIRINRKSWKKMIKKRSKHRSETYQISIQNRPKINQKSIENHSKIHPKSTNNLSKSPLERKKSRTSSWEPSWRRLGRVLGANMAASWPPKSSPNR